MRDANVSRHPDPVRVVGDAFLVFKIPIFGVLEPRDVGIQKNELRAVIVQVGVNIVLLSNGSNAAVVKKPDRYSASADRAESYLICAADIFVETIMEQIVPIGPARIAGANPDGMSQIYC